MRLQKRAIAVNLTKLSRINWCTQTKLSDNGVVIENQFLNIRLVQIFWPFEENIYLMYCHFSANSFPGRIPFSTLFSRERKFLICYVIKYDLNVLIVYLNLALLIDEISPCYHAFRFFTTGVFQFRLLVTSNQTPHLF